MKVGQMQDLDPLPAPGRHKRLGRLGLGKDNRLVRRDVGRRTKARAQAGADPLPVDPRHISLGQDLGPGGAEAAGAVRRQAGRVGREARGLAQRHHGVGQVGGRHLRDELADAQGGDAFRARRGEARVVGADDAADLGAGGVDEGLCRGVCEVG